LIPVPPGPINNQHQSGRIVLSYTNANLCL
jgi:hypothetical protein